MPWENIECPKCSHDEAVFLIDSDKEDTKIEIIYICSNPNCSYSWKKKILEN